MMDEVLEVRVTHPHTINGHYYVVREKDFYVIEMINEIERKPLTRTPDLYSRYLSVFEGLGCRVEIIKLEPLIVRYIDFGNCERISIDDLYELPFRWREKHALAFEVSLVPKPAQPLEQYSVVCIKRRSDGDWELRDDLITNSSYTKLSSCSSIDRPTEEPNCATVLLKSDVQEMKADRAIPSAATGDACRQTDSEELEVESQFEDCVDSSAPLENESFTVTVVNQGEAYGYSRVFKVMSIEKIADYKKLMEDFEDESLLNFNNFYGSAPKVGSLYAVERNDIVYRVRVTCDSPTLIDFVDDTPLSNGNGVKLFDDLFEKEELLILPPKYMDEDLVPFSILGKDSINSMDGAKITIKTTEFLGPDFWDVEVLDGGYDYSWDGDVETVQEDVANLQLFEIQEGQEDSWVKGEGNGDEFVALSEDEDDVKNFNL